MKKKLEKIKNFYQNNKQKVTFFGSIALVMLLIIITIAIAMKFVGIKISYEKLEEKLEQATYTYLIENPSEFPTSSNPTIVISADTLITNKYIKELKKYVKDSSCTANVLVDYVSNNNYKYQAYLNCKNFKTEDFIDVVKTNNKISQTGEGLYEINNELVFRGQNPNNFVSFANELWRIVKIDSNNNIQMILTESDDIYNMTGVWDDRYNSEEDLNYGVNNYSLSRALITTKDFYNQKYNSYQNYLSKFDLCAGKRASTSADKSGSLECNEIIKDQDIGLLPLYDYMNASLDGLCQTSISKQCQNYNYLVNQNYSWWTMTANMDNTYEVFNISGMGEINPYTASYSGLIRYVIALSSDVLYASGDGTHDNPYTIR